MYKTSVMVQTLDLIIWMVQLYRYLFLINRKLKDEQLAVNTQ